MTSKYAVLQTRFPLPVPGEPISLETYFNAFHNTPGILLFDKIEDAHEYTKSSDEEDSQPSAYPIYEITDSYDNNQAGFWSYPLDEEILAADDDEFSQFSELFAARDGSSHLRRARVCQQNEFNSLSNVTNIFFPTLEHDKKFDATAWQKLRYEKLKQDIQNSTIDSQELQRKLNGFLEKCDEFKSNGHSNLSDLADALALVSDLFSDDYAFQPRLQRLQGHPSVEMQVLGGLIAGLGILLAASGLLPVGAAVLLTGVGLFALGRQTTGLCKLVDDIEHEKRALTACS